MTSIESLENVPSVGDVVTARVDSHGFAFDVYAGKRYGLMGHYVEPSESIEYRRCGVSPSRGRYRVTSAGGKRAMLASMDGDEFVVFAVNFKAYGLEFAFWEVKKR